MALIPAGVILIWTGTVASIPSGWERVTDFDTKFPKGTANEVDPNDIGGNTSHSHTSPTHYHNIDSHTHTANLDSAGDREDTVDGSGGKQDSHTHSVTTSTTSGGQLSGQVTYQTATHNPPYHEVIYIRPSGSSAELEDDIVALFASVSIPTGWNFCDGDNDTPDLRNKYLRGAGVGQDAGGTGGSLTHNHDVGHGHSAVNHSHSGTSGQSSAPDHQLDNPDSAGGTARWDHTHSVTLNNQSTSVNNYSGSVDSGDVEPSYKKLLAIKNNTGGVSKPKGIIGLWLGSLVSIPGGWKLCDGNNETQDMRSLHLKICNITGEIGDTGGSNTHQHGASNSHTHTATGTHNHTGSSGNSLARGSTGVGAEGIAKTHSHALSSINSKTPTWQNSTVSSDEENNEPEYRTVAFIEYEATSQTIGVKANIFNIVTRTIQSKAYLHATMVRTTTVKASIFNLVTQNISVKASILKILTITPLKALGKIIPSQAFIEEVNKTIRQMTSKLEIKWDGISWTDESDYFVSAHGNEQLAKLTGEGIASTLDIELDNTTERFTPDNTSSPIYGYLKPRVNIRLSIVMGGYAYRMFTGYIKNIHPDMKSRVCSLECFDNQVYVYNKRANGVVYEDYRSDQLLEVLADLADLDESQYYLDEGSHVVNFGYFEDRNVWPIMGEIAVAERGRVFFDRYGILRFWGRNRLHNKGSYLNLTLSDWIVDSDYSVAEHEIKNVVIVKAKPRASAGIQVVWSSGNAEYLDPYTDTLVWIPANSVQLAWLELEDPCVTLITPIANTDYTANSAQDGSGDDLTNNISIHEFINYGNAIFINVINNGAVDAYLTKFQIRGNPARVLKWIKAIARDDTSISLYGRQEFEVENDFIDNESAAIEIANEELYRRRDAVNLFRLDIIGIPHLECGDVVNVEYRKSEVPTWTVQYEANELPDAATPAWTKSEDFGATTEEISPAGFLHTVTELGKIVSYYIIDNNFSVVTGWTVEARLKIISGYTYAQATDVTSITVQTEDDESGDYIEIYTDGVDLNYGTFVAFDTTDDYHVYRLTRKGTTVNFYIDGVLVRTVTNDISGSGVGRIWFEPSYYDQGVVEVSTDYVYYRTDGAYEPETNNFKEFMIDELNWILDDGGFRQRLTLVNPYIFPEIKTVDVRGYIVSALQNIQAKANIT